MELFFAGCFVFVYLLKRKFGHHLFVARESWIGDAEIIDLIEKKCNYCSGSDIDKA